MSYKVLPHAALRFSLSLVLVEIWTGAGLFWKRTATYGAAIGGILLFGFTILLIVEYLSGFRGSCGCGTVVLLKNVGISKIIENCLILAMAVLYVRHETMKKTKELGERR